MKRLFFFTLAIILLSFDSFAQPPSGYYTSADGKTGVELKIALYNIIKDHTVVSYNGLWSAFQYTDKKPNGKVWDMYSDIPGGTPPYEFTFFNDQCGNYSGEGDCYNREHSFPKSWFYDGTPMYSDLFHLYPTDGYVNGQRGNYPFGRVGSATWTSLNGSKKGNSNYPGYTGIVFEPIDAYKGDFARSYFYMVTRYHNVVQNWSSPMLANNQFPAFTTWALNLLLEWHQADPVSQKEIDRNNKIYYDYQDNRNPFIDNPQYALLIWTDQPTPVSISSTAVTSVNVFQNYNYSITTSGGTGSAITVTCTQKPLWMIFTQTGNGTAQLSGIPMAGDVGNHNVTISATDGTTTDVQQFVVVVSSTTTPVNFTSTPVLTATVYQNYQYSITASGHPLATLTISCNQKPEWMNFLQTGNGTASLTGSPSFYDIGNHPVSLTVTDGISNKTQTFVVSVLGLDVNFTTTPITLAKIDETYEYIISAEVVGNTSAVTTISCNEKPDWLTFAAGGLSSASLSGIPSLQDIGSHYVELVATYQDFSSTQAFNILVFEHGLVLDFIEPFENIPENSPLYESRSWVGENDFEWNVTQSRTDQIIDERAICFENQGEPYLQSQLLPGGCTRVSFILQQKFDGEGGAVTLFINGEQFGSPFIATQEVQTADFQGIETLGNFVIKLVSNGLTNIAIDNLSWQSLSQGEPPEIAYVNHYPLNPTNGDDVEILADIVSESGIASASIHWGSASNNLTEEEAMIFSNGFYRGIITVPSEASSLWYQIHVMDNTEQVAVSDIYEIVIIQSQPPIVESVEFYPLNPNSNQSVSVRATASDPDEDPISVTLVWGINPESLTNSIPMSVNTSFYECLIPSNPANTHVYFTIVAEDNWGASGSSSIFTYFVSPASSATTINDPIFIVSPNPAKSKIFITCNYPEPISLQMFSIMGNILIDENIAMQNKTISLDVSQLSNGLYFIKIIGRGFVKSLRVIIEQ
jgi:endonuclease I